MVSPVPDKLLVSSMFHAEHCSGTYVLMTEEVNGHPAWASTDSMHWLFSTRAGGWMISDDNMSLKSPDSSGLIASVGRHKGTMPHLIKEWQVGDGEGWHIDQSIGVAMLPEVLSLTARASSPPQSKVQSPQRTFTARVASVTPSTADERLKLADAQVDALMQQCDALQEDSDTVRQANTRLEEDLQRLQVEHRTLLDSLQGDTTEISRLREELEAKNNHLKGVDSRLQRAEYEIGVMRPKVLSTEAELERERERASQQEMETKEIVQKLLQAEAQARDMNEHIRRLEQESASMTEAQRKMERETSLQKLSLEKKERDVETKLNTAQSEALENNRRATQAEHQLVVLKRQIGEYENALVRQNEAATDKQRLIKAEKEVLELRGMPTLLVEAEKELKNVLMRLTERENELALMKKEQFRNPTPSDTASVMVQPIPERNLVSPPPNMMGKKLSPVRKFDLDPVPAPSTLHTPYSKQMITPTSSILSVAKQPERAFEAPLPLGMATPDVSSRQEKNFIGMKQDKFQAPVLNVKKTMADYGGGKMSPVPVPVKEDRCISPSAFKVYPQSRHCSPQPAEEAEARADLSARDDAKMWVHAPKVQHAEGLYIRQQTSAALAWVSNNDKWFIVSMDSASRMRWFLVVGEGQGYSKILNKVKSNKALLRSEPIKSTSTPPYMLTRWEVNQSGFWQHDVSIVVEKADEMY